MTKIKDLIATLGNRNPEAQVFLMTQRKDPYENHLAGIVGRQEMQDQQCRIEPGIASDDVFLVVGKRIRRGSPNAWIATERASAHVQLAPAIERGESQQAAASAQSLSAEAVEILYRYLSCAQQDRDNDMLIDVLVALKPGRGNEEAWTRIRRFAVTASEA